MKRWMLLAAVLLLLLGTGCQRRSGGATRESPGVDRQEDRSGETSSGEGSSGESSSLPSREPSDTITVVVPEGFTLAKIGMLLEEKGVCGLDEFLLAAQLEDAYGEYPLLGEQEAGEFRCFRLEGYLFPATYQLNRDSAPEQVIRTMLATMEERITFSLREEIRSSGYTMDEILTIASIIEKEAFGQRYMADISSVLHNRLDTGMKLQCDVTITYVEGAIKPFISGDKNYYNEHYNTYKCDALPAGPICNPGLAAIRAALYPSDTGFFYFVTDEEDQYYFAETWEEHLKNVAAAGL